MSQRLDAIIRMAPQVNTVADIGCDHGKIAVSLLIERKAEQAICSDISGKSLEKAKKLARSKGLENRVSFREGNGLSVLGGNEADAAIIAGMGGELIARILEEAGGNVPDTLILSCNTKPEILRAWLCTNGFVIEDEELAAEDRRFYPVMLAKKGRSQQLSALELEFGPVLLKEMPETLLRLIDRRISREKEYIKDIKAHGSKSAAQQQRAIEEKIKIYEELKRGCIDG